VYIEDISQIPPLRTRNDMSQNATLQKTTHTVLGMTCDHCALSVAEEVEAVDGVLAADVDLASGRLVVTGERADESAIAAAVEEAGYEVAR